LLTGGYKMDIISNLNERLTIIDDGSGVCHGGEEYIKKVVEQSPVKLPDDYVDFLKVISGANNIGISFKVDGGVQEFFIWGAKFAYECVNTEYSHPVYADFLSCTWLIGDDVGEFRYFYGEGAEGFGIYKTTAGEMDICGSNKIADSLTDLLINGVGLDILFAW